MITIVMDNMYIARWLINLLKHFNNVIEYWLIMVKNKVQNNCF